MNHKDSIVTSFRTRKDIRREIIQKAKQLGMSISQLMQMLWLEYGRKL